MRYLPAPFLSPSLSLFLSSSFSSGHFLCLRDDLKAHIAEQFELTLRFTGLCGKSSWAWPEDIWFRLQGHAQGRWPPGLCLLIRPLPVTHSKQVDGLLIHKPTDGHKIEMWPRLMNATFVIFIQESVSLLSVYNLSFLDPRKFARHKTI